MSLNQINESIKRNYIPEKKYNKKLYDRIVESVERSTLKRKSGGNLSVYQPIIQESIEAYTGKPWYETADINMQQILFEEYDIKTAAKRFLKEEKDSLDMEEIPTTKEWIKTPRGTFDVTSLTKDEIEKKGYGYHHSSDDRKYSIYSNGTDAYAVKNESVRDVKESKKRIAKVGEFDNGKVLYDYQDLSDEEAEEKAKQKSIEFKDDIFYVKNDDIMNPQSRYKWKNGKRMGEDTQGKIKDYLYNEDKKDFLESDLDFQVIMISQFIHDYYNIVDISEKMKFFRGLIEDTLDDNFSTEMILLNIYKEMYSRYGSANELFYYFNFFKKNSYNVDSIKELVYETDYDFDEFWSGLEKLFSRSRNKEVYYQIAINTILDEFGLSSSVSNELEKFISNFVEKYADYFFKWLQNTDESLSEDTEKTSKGKWVNKGDSGKTHGTFNTKRQADAQRKAMFARGYKAESFKEDWTSIYDKFEAIVDKYLPDEDKINREIKKLYYLHKGEPDWDKAWEKWNRPNMYNISESKYHRYKNRVNEAEDTIGKDVEKYQRWVDYDMKKYKRVSDQTKRELKKAGLQLVKDQYGDYEVIAAELKKESINRRYTTKRLKEQMSLEEKDELNNDLLNYYVRFGEFKSIDEYDSDYINKQDYNAAVNRVKKALSNIDLDKDLYKEWPNGELSLQLHDNPTMNYLDNENKSQEEYADLVDEAVNIFEGETGVELYRLGRSGRHICVELNYENAKNYNKLRNKALKLEQWVIDEFNSDY